MIVRRWERLVSMSETSTVDERIGEFYDDVAGMIEILGGNVHVGYWWNDDDRTPFLEAINRLTDIVGAKLDLRPGQHLLDIGCGAGVPAIRLGQRTDADITGITVSGWQVGEATRRVNAAGLRGQVRIEYGDGAALAYPDGSFDAVLAFESLSHAPDRGQWLREMVRVLRPGGRVVLTDFIEEVPLAEPDIELLRAFTMEPPLPSLELVDLVRSSGFDVDEFVSCGDRVRRYYTAYFQQIARRRTELVAVYGKEQVDKYETGMVPLLGLCREKIGYVIIAGRKPV
jgi:cyclopropane fatty-acyl-phospholipid synthase-like methyltransferase